MLEKQDSVRIDPAGGSRPYGTSRHQPRRREYTFRGAVARVQGDPPRCLPYRLHPGHAPPSGDRAPDKIRRSHPHSRSLGRVAAVAAHSYVGCSGRPRSKADKRGVPAGAQVFEPGMQLRTWQSLGLVHCYGLAGSTSVARRIHACSPSKSRISWHRKMHARPHASANHAIYTYRQRYPHRGV